MGVSDTHVMLERHDTKAEDKRLLCPNQEVCQLIAFTLFAINLPLLSCMRLLQRRNIQLLHPHHSFHRSSPGLPIF